ncbi:hypothetical protein [uncultured Mediterranean phage uvDeep-CGR2-KM18-C74]|nr:hypothetical protein [uncultured Mediterranean phage uvDeep-CGR2-KM18-C74]
MKIKNGITYLRKCCLCNKAILPTSNDPGAHGHNAEPLKKGLCCDNCVTDVINSRIH